MCSTRGTVRSTEPCGCRLLCSKRGTRMSRKLIVVAGLLSAVVAITFDTSVAEAGRCCRARRSCGGGYNQGYYNTGCNTGYNMACNPGGPGPCAVNACQPAAGGRLIADPANPGAPQAEVVAPPPPDAVPAPAQADNAPPPPPAESAKVKPEGESANN